MTKSYEDRLQDNAERARWRSQVARDIARSYPEAGDLARRERCGASLRVFLETYFPSAFSLAWSRDHLRVIDRIEETAKAGGLFALAMPRGSGKTTICERAALWALLYGYRRFVVLIGSAESSALKLLENIKTEITSNDALMADHRQVCYPIQRLGGAARQARGQLFEGKPTAITWETRRLSFPVMPDTACDGPNVSGSCVVVAGLMGSFRGLSHAIPGGDVIRPDMVILDDPQTRESALSAPQTARRLETINGDILGLAGPGNPIAAVIPCTVIAPADLSDTLLDRERSPQWRGERTKAVAAWPKDRAKWDRYLAIRREEQQGARPAGSAAAFYAANREAMDAGAVVSWPERHDPGETAIQTMTHKRADMGAAAFDAEYQNSPQKDGPAETVALSAAELRKRTAYPRGAVPAGAVYLTAMIDVHDAALFWCVCAWSADFSGWVVDYGVWPQQRAAYYTLRTASPTLADKYPGQSKEGAIRAGLDELIGVLTSKKWELDGGGYSRVEKVGVDAGYVPDIVFEAARAAGAVVIPTRGQGIRAGQRPIGEWGRRPGERHGPGWIVSRPSGRPSVWCRFDSNQWKSFIVARLTTPSLSDPGALALFSGSNHQVFIDNLTAETSKLVSTGGRTVEEWTTRPDRPDNHFFDTLVGAAVVASVCGARLAMPGGQAKRQTKRSWAEAQRAARARREGRK